MSLITGNGKSVTIPTPSITSIIIDSDFENRFMPIIYANLIVETNLYNMIVDNYNDGKIYLHVSYYDANTSFALHKDRVKGNFIYFPPTNHDYRSILQDGNANVDNSYNKLTIGLLDADILNFNGKTFNGVYKDVTNTSILELIVTGREFVIDPLDRDREYKSFFMPPTETVSKAIAYLYNYSKFFDTKYIYFNDFKVSFLTKIFDRKQNLLGNTRSVIINVSKINIADAFFEGMEVDRDSCILYLNGSNIKYSRNDYSNKVANEIMSTDIEPHKNEITNIAGKGNAAITAKRHYVRTDVSNSLANTVGTFDTSQYMISITKRGINGSILNPDVIYKLDTSNESDAMYNGSYSIMRKKELIVKKDMEYNNIVTASFRKLIKD